VRPALSGITQEGSVLARGRYFTVSLAGELTLAYPTYQSIEKLLTIADDWHEKPE
jgi:hypothetical protein